MRKWLPLLTVCLGTFMLLIDVTIVNVALPDMAQDLKTSFSSLQWVVDAYALTLAALVLGTGSIADLVGHRRAYIAGLALFALSSLACGLAPEPGLPDRRPRRAGLGAAAMFATTFALLNSNYTGRDRGTAYGHLGRGGRRGRGGRADHRRSAHRGRLLAVDLLRQPADQRGRDRAVLCASSRTRTPPTESRVDVPGMVTFTGCGRRASPTR